jgi:uncharacterized membrane protein YphA (DoxX/SURF4 family)
MWTDTLLKNTLAPLVLRLALAVIFIYHGWHKISDPDADWGARWADTLTEQKDNPPPEVVNRLKAYFEMQKDREKAGKPVDNPLVLPEDVVDKISLAYHKVAEAHYTRANENTAVVQLSSSVQMLVAWGELVGGVVLLLGLMTRWAALCLIVIQVGAIALVTGARGFAPTGEAGYEYNVALVAMLLGLVFLGSGTLALNRLFWRSRPATPPAPAPESTPALR